MGISWVWFALVASSLVFGGLNGRLEAVSRAALEGADDAVRLCLSLAGSLALWSGLMAALRRAGVTKLLTRLLRPLLRRLFPGAGETAMTALSENVTANLLGLGSAATPAGIRAAELLHDGSGTAGPDLCMLVVLNTASLQLIPMTVAGVRAAAGAQAPYDILAPVWLTSLAALAAGVGSAKLFSRVWGKGT